MTARLDKHVNLCLLEKDSEAQAEEKGVLPSSVAAGEYFSVLVSSSGESTVRSGGIGSRHLLAVSQGCRQKDAPPRSAASAPPKPFTSINTPSRTLTMSSGCDASRSERGEEEEGKKGRRR
jgi:hypothetical protein